MKLEPILKKRGFKATYNHPFFIHCKDRTRLPDFVNVRTHEVIEFFGTYWHRDRVLPDGKKHETEEYVIEQYALVGWDCKIIWEYQFDEYIKGNSNV